MQHCTCVRSVRVADLLLAHARVARVAIRRATRAGRSAAGLGAHASMAPCRVLDACGAARSSWTPLALLVLVLVPAPCGEASRSEEQQDDALRGDASGQQHRQRIHQHDRALRTCSPCSLRVHLDNSAR